MEKSRRRRSHARISSPVKVTTHSHLKETGKHISSSQSRFDSSPSSSVATVEVDRLTLNRGRNSKLPTGTPMKKLLADEISKDSESKRRSPSIIARLMGLDGFPTQHSISKQHKRLSDEYQRNGVFRKNGGLYNCRETAKWQQEFKDVYEVAESLNTESWANTSSSASNLNPSDDEIAFIRQKFMDVKCFSTDVKLHHSKEFHDALEVLYSNKDILLKFLHESDPLFSKHLHDLRHAHESHGRHGLRMKSRNTLQCNIDAIGWQSGAEASQKIDISHSHKYRGSGHSRKLNPQAEGKEDASSIPTKIVVLKPNLDKMQNTAASVFSPSPSCDPGSDLDSCDECSNVLHAGYEMRSKIKTPDDFDVYKCKSRESGDLARKITRRMRNKLGVDAFSISSSCRKGYSADESSHDSSENDSSYESEVTLVSSETSLKKSFCNKASTSQCTGSSVNREAKRRLSERWKMTHRSQEVGASGKGSTLGEMLAVPEVDIRPRSPDSVVAPDEFLQRFGGNDGISQLSVPLGISSRDGWKDEHIRSLSKSRSLQASYHLGSPKSCRKLEANVAQRCLIRKERTDHGAVIRTESKGKEGSFSESMKSCNKKFQSSHHASVEIIHDTHEAQFSRGMMVKCPGGRDSSDVKDVILEMSSCRHGTNLSCNTVTDKEHIKDCDSLNYPDEQLLAPGITCLTPSQDDSSQSDLSVPSGLEEPSTSCDASGSSCLQCVASQPAFPVSSKETEQPSPVSVLEGPFTEELSSGSECFERVSAELHGLRMQLQLLRLESQAYNEGFMIVSSDEDVESSTDHRDCRGSLGVGESWESSYLVDVLAKAGLDETNPDLFIGTWHSPDCPVAPWVFEALEKKYLAWESCLTSERKLLFDSINSAIIEISRNFVDLHWWMKPPPIAGRPQWRKDLWLKTELQNSLKKHETNVTNIAMNTLILDNMSWLELAEHIDSIGRDIEGLVIDELVAEILPV